MPAQGQPGTNLPYQSSRLYLPAYVLGPAMAVLVLCLGIAVYASIQGGMSAGTWAALGFLLIICALFASSFQRITVTEDEVRITRASLFHTTIPRAEVTTIEAGPQVTHLRDYKYGPMTAPDRTFVGNRMGPSVRFGTRGGQEYTVVVRDEAERNAVLRALANPR